jgi:hypothetical protein
LDWDLLIETIPAQWHSQAFAALDVDDEITPGDWDEIPCLAPVTVAEVRSPDLNCAAVGSTEIGYFHALLRAVQQREDVDSSAIAAADPPQEFIARLIRCAGP